MGHRGMHSLLLVGGGLGSYCSVGVLWTCHRGRSTPPLSAFARNRVLGRGLHFFWLGPDVRAWDGSMNRHSKSYNFGYFWFHFEPIIG